MSLNGVGPDHIHPKMDMRAFAAAWTDVKFVQAVPGQLPQKLAGLDSGGFQYTDCDVHAGGGGYGDARSPSFIQVVL